MPGLSSVPQLKRRPPPEPSCGTPADLPTLRQGSGATVQRIQPSQQHQQWTGSRLGSCQDWQPSTPIEPVASSCRMHMSNFRMPIGRLKATKHLSRTKRVAHMRPHPTCKRGRWAVVRGWLDDDASAIFPGQTPFGSASYGITDDGLVSGTINVQLAAFTQKQEQAAKQLETLSADVAAGKFRDVHAAIGTDAVSATKSPRGCER